jgi:hypothetical protein
VEVYTPIPEELLHRIPRAVRRVGRIVLVVLLGVVLMVAAVAVLRFAFRERLPNLFERPTLTQGKTYRYRIPIGGCGAPIVVVNRRNWDPDTPWPYAPFPKTWHMTTEGSHYHTTQYLTGTVRLEPDRLIVSLPNGTVVKRYHPTTHPTWACA